MSHSYPRRLLADDAPPFLAYNGFVDAEFSFARQSTDKGVSLCDAFVYSNRPGWGLNVCDSFSDGRAPVA